MTLAEMGRRFHAASGQSCGFDEQAFLAVMAACDEKGGLFVTDGGFLAGVMSSAWCDPEWKIAVELAWWAEDGKGLRLLRSFEKWARKNGADEIRMTTLQGLDRAQEILTRRGYGLSELSWTRLKQWQ